MTLTVEFDLDRSREPERQMPRSKLANVESNCPDTHRETDRQTDTHTHTHVGPIALPYLDGSVA